MASRLESWVGALQKLAQENEQLLQETKITAVSEERRRLARDSMMQSASSCLPSP